MAGLDTIKSLGLLSLWFLPPSHDLDLTTANGVRVYKWRLVMAFGLISCIVSVVALFFIGTGHASAADVANNTGKLIALEIDAADYTVCMESTDDNGVVDPQVVNYITQLEMQYLDATGRKYTHKPCSLLLKLRR